VQYDRRVGQSQTGWRVCSRVAAGEQAGGEVDAEEDPNKAMMLVGRERKPGTPTESREERGTGMVKRSGEDWCSCCSLSMVLDASR